jgi:hypothetical protein
LSVFPRTPTPRLRSRCRPRTDGTDYVAHTANDPVDVIDVQAQRYLGSITGLPAVAGAYLLKH